MFGLEVGFEDVLDRFADELGDDAVFLAIGSSGQVALDRLLGWRRVWAGDD